MAGYYIVNVEGATWRDGRYMLVVRGPEEEHAAGLLALVGGKVETDEAMADVLEETLRREILEETGVIVSETVYVHSTHFGDTIGQTVVDVVFLCRYQSGQPTIDDPGEVAEILWLTADEVQRHRAAPPWTKNSIERVEQARLKLNW